MIKPKTTNNHDIDPKLEYLIKTLSRTKKKDYENYVVNAIWQRLDNSNIKPVTQQYIKRSSDKYALMDMYFPQLNVGVEVDEPHHNSTVTLDIIRQLDIETSIEILDEPHNFIMKRVKINNSFEDIETQINEIVIELKRIISQTKISPWNINQSPVDILKENQRLSVYDDVRFRRIQEVANGLGLTRFPIQRGYFRLSGNNWLWFPNLATTVEGELRVQGSHGWMNVLSDNRKQIFEYRLDPAEMQGLDHQDNHLRITFARSRDVLGRRLYRFIGVYEFSLNDSTHEKRVYNRIAETITFGELEI